MIVRKEKLQIQKAPVQVTQDIYEIWYSKPMSLGNVQRQGVYWYTADGMKFRSSRDAMEYLIKLYDASGKVLEGSPKLPPVIAKSEKQTLPTTGKKTHMVDEEAINQNHPMFQEFLDFVDWKSRRKLASVAQHTK